MNSSEDQQMNGGDKKSESFIVDLECFSNDLEMDPTNSGTTTNNSSTFNPRIIMQRSLSRKGMPRGSEKKIDDKDHNIVSSSSPRGAQVVGMLEKPISTPAQPMGSQDHFINNNQLPQQHQITIKTGGVSTITDGRWIKRSSFKRTPPSWFSDPKRVVLFFASLSSIGTLLLIYFTLSMTKQNDEDENLRTNQPVRKRRKLDRCFRSMAMVWLVMACFLWPLTQRLNV